MNAIFESEAEFERAQSAVHESLMPIRGAAYQQETERWAKTHKNPTLDLWEMPLPPEYPELISLDGYACEVVETLPEDWVSPTELIE